MDLLLDTLILVVLPHCTPHPVIFILQNSEHVFDRAMAVQCSLPLKTLGARQSAAHTSLYPKRIFPGARLW
jgi:hypothetical protein